MLFSFFKKKSDPTPPEDTVLEDQMEQTMTRAEHDRKDILERLERDYPSPESAIEDYRRGYISDEQLEMRFDEDDIRMIKEERDERDVDDATLSTTGYQ